MNNKRKRITRTKIIKEQMPARVCEVGPGHGEEKEENKKIKSISISENKEGNDLRASAM